MTLAAVVAFLKRALLGPPRQPRPDPYFSNGVRKMEFTGNPGVDLALMRAEVEIERDIERRREAASRLRMAGCP